MSPHPIEENLLPKLIKYLFSEYVKEFGYSKASLDKYEILSAILEPPEEFFVKTSSGTQTTYVHYLSELKARGFLSQQGGLFKITESGYRFGYESLHPVKTFHRNHWKWLYGSLIVGLLTAFATLFAGAQSNPLCTLLQKVAGN